MKDIESREDIQHLVDQFYRQVVADDLIGHFFTHVVKLDWDRHMPVMYDFWESILLGKMNYQGNPMLKHIELNAKSPLKSAHFDRWLSLWESTIQAHYSGTKAEEAMRRAQQIGELMKHKIQQHQASQQ